jgi:arabinose-5-phosphate isomerase
MTTSPITVRETALAAEVIKILRENRIDDVIVLNNEDKAVGMIDVQDLSRLGLS